MSDKRDVIHVNVCACGASSVGSEVYHYAVIPGGGHQKVEDFHTVERRAYVAVDALLTDTALDAAYCAYDDACADEMRWQDRMRAAIGGALRIAETVGRDA